MEEYRVFFIGLDETSDKEPRPELIKEIDSKISWVANKVTENFIVLTSPILECIRIALKISESLAIPYEILEALSDKKSFSYKHNRELSSKTPFFVPNFSSTREVKNLISYLNKQSSSFIIILEENVFGRLNLDCVKRSAEYFTMHEYKVLDGQDLELSLVIDYNSVLKEVLKKLPGRIVEELARTYGNVSKEVLDIYQGVISYIKSFTKTLSDSIKPGPKKDSSFEDIGTKVKFIKEILSKIDLQLTSIHQTADKIQEFKEIDKNIIETDNLIEILRFQYILDQGLWIIKVKNPTDKLIKKLEIYSIEYNLPIHRFQAIQPDCTIKKYLKLDIKDWYGKHLVAVLNGNIVSDVFPITPFHISNNLAKRNFGDILITITNQSFHAFSDLKIVTSNSNKPLDLQRATFRYKDSEEIELNTSDVENAVIFLVQGNAIISNHLIYTNE
jgi:hypothetical protein